ncbi:MAG: hypothetical protein M1380_11995 [Chloroflexi bacterium]|nr:hypothetical protein [Chloroflexota bacterium]
MAAEMTERADTVAWGFEQAPDEAYLGFSMASIFASTGLYLMGRRDDALMVGVLGPAFAITGLMIKLLGHTRGVPRRG